MGSATDRRPLVVIVDDDEALRESLALLLEDNGFHAKSVSGSQDYFALATRDQPDLALIDLKLDGESGLALAVRIRQTSAIPIVMLTGRGDETDKIIGLETGADDYLMKPFNTRELVARLRAVLRRSGHQVFQPAENRSEGPGKSFGPYRLDLERRELVGSDGDVPLTNGEFRILELLLRNEGRPVSRAELLMHLGSDVSHYVDRTVDVLILRLRRKIEAVPSKPVFLQTRRGQGYVLVPDPDRSAGG